jgi:hypothetical protein
MTHKAHILEGYMLLILMNVIIHKKYILIGRMINVEIGILPNVRIPALSDHRFRKNPTTDSDSKRPLIPKLSDHKMEDFRNAGRNDRNAGRNDRNAGRNDRNCRYERIFDGFPITLVVSSIILEKRYNIVTREGTHEKDQRSTAFVSS